MTTALIWWIAVLGVTWGLVLAVRAWRWVPPGWRRLRESLPLLAACTVAGLGVAACVLTMAGRRVRAWWPLAGLLPALGGAALLLGV